jgi:hypothetical protein
VKAQSLRSVPKGASAWCAARDYHARPDVAAAMRAMPTSGAGSANYGDYLLEDDCFVGLERKLCDRRLLIVAQ